MHTTPVALITGANTGIGLQVAKDLAGHGLTVLVGSRHFDRGEIVAREIQGEAFAVQLDVTDAESIAAAAERVRSEFGRLDVLVNNAGVSFLGDPSTPLQERARSGLLTKVPIDVVRRIFETNVICPIALTQALLLLLLDAPAARIVNVGSSGSSLTLTADPSNLHRSMFGILSDDEVGVARSDPRVRDRTRADWHQGERRRPRIHGNGPEQLPGDQDRGTGSPTHRREGASRPGRPDRHLFRRRRPAALVGPPTRQPRPRADRTRSDRGGAPKSVRAATAPLPTRIPRVHRSTPAAHRARRERTFP